MNYNLQFQFIHYVAHRQPCGSPIGDIFKVIDEDNKKSKLMVDWKEFRGGQPKGWRVFRGLATRIDYGN